MTACPRQLPSGRVSIEFWIDDGYRIVWRYFYWPNYRTMSGRTDARMFIGDWLAFQTWLIEEGYWTWDENWAPPTGGPVYGQTYVADMFEFVVPDKETRQWN